MYESFNLKPTYTPNSGSLKTAGSRNLSDPGTKTSLKDQVSLGACKPFFRSTKVRRAGSFLLVRSQKQIQPNNSQELAKSAETKQTRTFVNACPEHSRRMAPSVQQPICNPHALIQPKPKKHTPMTTSIAVRAYSRSPVLCRPFTLHNSNFTIYFMPTTYGDIQQKNRQPIFGRVETSMKMTFHSTGENQRATRRRRTPLSKTPLLFFHYENTFRKKRTAKPRQTQSRLTPMITLQINAENQISKRRRGAAVGQAFQPDVARHQTPQPFHLSTFAGESAVERRTCQAGKPDLHTT